VLPTLTTPSVLNAQRLGGALQGALRNPLLTRELGDVGLGHGTSGQPLAETRRGQVTLRPRTALGGAVRPGDREIVRRDGCRAVRGDDRLACTGLDGIQQRRRTHGQVAFDHGKHIAGCVAVGRPDHEDAPSGAGDADRSAACENGTPAATLVEMPDHLHGCVCGLGESRNRGEPTPLVLIFVRVNAGVERSAQRVNNDEAGVSLLRRPFEIRDVVREGCGFQ
jgi:hypothetical protein